MRTSSVVQYAFRMTFGQASAQSSSNFFSTPTSERVLTRSAAIMAVFGIALSSFSLKQLASSRANKSSKAALTLRKV